MDLQVRIPQYLLVAERVVGHLVDVGVVKEIAHQRLNCLLNRVYIRNVVVVHRRKYHLLLLHVLKRLLLLQ